MAQADGNIANQTGAGFRADLNNQLLALFTQHSGNAEPVTKYAFQPWIDTSASPPLWKIRNSANTAWITIGTLDATFSIGGVTAIANGGTGQTTASGAINALVPSQTGNSGNALITNGTAVSWGAIATSQEYYYDANNTWTKPSTGTFALVTIWGGGGAGGRNNNYNNAAGGGGGGCVQRLYLLSELPSSVSITIAAQVAGRSSDGNGANGNNTTFGALLTAYGGGGGTGTGSAVGQTGGGGGGSRAAGANGSSGGAGGDGHGTALTGGNGNSISNDADFGGGGGGGYVGGSYTTGGSSYWGGGGGGCRLASTTRAGGVSLHGGNGGSGASSNGIAGSVPGGGGGGCESGTSGAGAAGACRIYVW